MMREFLFCARILDFILKAFPLWNLKLKEGNVSYRILVIGKRRSAKTLSFVFSGQKQCASRDIKLQVDKSFCYSCSVALVSYSLQPHGLQHARLPCPSASPGVCLNSCPLSWSCHPTISSSVTPCSSCLQSFPASGSFLLNWLFTSGGQNIGTSASTSALPMNIQGWFPLGQEF